MRRSSLVAGVVAFALALPSAGCTYYETLPEGARCGDRDPRASSAEGSYDQDPYATYEADERPPAYRPKEEGRFEAVARLVLGAIPYKDCGAGGRGDVDVTFEPNGIVQKVVVWADAWQDPTKQCVAERFALAHVAPFAGDARAVRWHVVLSESNGWGL